MKLTHHQKKYIKKNRKEKSIQEMARILDIPEDRITAYIKDKKFIIDQVEEEKVESEKISTFNFKFFLTKNIRYFLILFILIAIAYINSLNNDFVSDDRYAFVYNPKWEFKSVFDAPFVFINTLKNYIILSIFGLRPIFFRLVNIFFHIGSTFLVFIILSLLSSTIIAFFTASFFAVHPILIESVTWISGGAYAQYSFFILLTMVFYILSNQNKKYYYLSLFFFIVSLFSSEKAIVVFLIIVLLEISFGKIRENWKKLLPFLLVNFILVVYYISLIGLRVEGLNTTSYQHDLSPFFNPLIQIPTAVSTYFQLIFWPQQLTLYHSDFLMSQSTFLIRFAVFIFYDALIIYFYKKNKLIFFWLAFFLIALSPTLIPYKIAWIVAERYVYLGSIGIFFVFSYLLNKIFQKKQLDILKYLLFTILIIALIGRTIIRNIDWKNEDNLWLATAKYTKTDPKIYNNLGDVYSRRKDYKKAIESFKKAIDLNPNYADAYHNLANTYQVTGEIEIATKYYNKALELNPNLWQSLQQLAVIYFNKKNFNKAEKLLERSLKIQPNNAYLHFNLGIVYKALDRKDLAVKQLEIALHLKPDDEAMKRFYSTL